MTPEEIKIINVDNMPYVVEALPPQIRSLVVLYNEWNVETVNTRNELIKLDIAMKGMAQSIVMAIRAEKQKAEKDAAAAVPDANGAVVMPANEEIGAPDIIAVREDSLTS
ncbi:MAG: hypothetical protein ACREAU_00280 [Nitrosopumilaceae archaeon]